MRKGLMTLILLLSFVCSLSAQQNQQDKEIEALKQQVDDAKLEKFGRELERSNSEWLRGWSSWFIGVLGLFLAVILGVGGSFWYWLRHTASQLMEDKIEKNLNGFKEAIRKMEAVEGRISELRENARSEFEGARKEIDSTKGLLMDLREDVVQTTVAGLEPSEELAMSLNAEMVFKVLKGAAVIEGFTGNSSETTKGHAMKLLGYKRYPPVVSYILEYLPERLNSELESSKDSNEPIDLDFMRTVDAEIVTLLLAGTPEANEGLIKIIQSLGEKEVGKASEEILDWICGYTQEEGWEREIDPSIKEECRKALESVSSDTADGNN